jgi:hypothetical protein
MAVPLTSSPVAVSSGWTEITLPNSAVAKWDADVIYATLDNKLVPMTRSATFQYVSSLGSDFQLISDKGVSYNLSSGGYQFSTDVSLVLENPAIPKGAHFVRLRMRCSKPVTFSRIVWFSYMPQDTKTGLP